MRFGICAGFKTGYENLRYILEQTSFRPEIVLTSVKDTSQYEVDISNLCVDFKIPVKRGVKANDPAIVELIKFMKIELGFLLWWPEILKKASIEPPSTPDRYSVAANSQTVITASACTCAA